MEMENGCPHIANANVSIWILVPLLIMMIANARVDIIAGQFKKHSKNKKIDFIN